VTNFYYYEWFARNHSDYGSFGVFWSLSLEEQFYLVFPCLLFFAGRRWLIPILLCAFFAQALIYRPSGFTPQHTSLLWFVRTDALILGVLIAFWKSRRSYHRLQPRFMRHPWIALPVVALCVVALAAVPAASPVAHFSTGIAAILSGLLVLFASYDQNYIFPAFRIKPALVWLGARSYGIYLIHVTCRSFILELKKTAGIAEGSTAAAIGSVVSVVVILLLAELNYRWVEAPGRKIGRRVADGLRRRIKPAAVPEMPRLLQEPP
jgi:peptidoglycan/LPS O-acetylase OafA/YrhL